MASHVRGRASHRKVGAPPVRSGSSGPGEREDQP
jgi:hypothetical protein